MRPDLIILGGGIAGLSAALGACDRGAFPLVLEAGAPPEPGGRFDVLFDDDFAPFGGPPPMAPAWACTRVLGLATPEGHQRRRGHVIDREALRQQLMSKALQHGATVAWHTAARWEADTAKAAGHDLPDVPVLLASSAFIPADVSSVRRRYRSWHGRGTPVSSYLVAPRLDPGSHFVTAMTGAGRWCTFGWQALDAPDPVLPPSGSGATLRFERERPVITDSTRRPAGTTWLSGEPWLRLGSAAGLEPGHGLGLAAKLALSRMAGWLAADWTLQGSGLEAWSSYAAWLAPYQYMLQQSGGRLTR